MAIVAELLDEADVRAEEKVEAEFGVVELGGFEFEFVGLVGKELSIERRGFEGRPEAGSSSLSCGTEFAVVIVVVVFELVIVLVVV